LDPGSDEWNYWSDEMFRSFEFDPQQSPPMVEMSRQRIHPEDREPVHQRTLNVLRDKGEYVNHYRLLLPDGRIKYLHVIGHPVFNEAGEITEFVGTSVDVTEQKRSEDALRRSEAYLAEAQQLSHTGSFGWDAASGEIYWSPETFRIFELDPAEKVTIDLIRQWTHPEDRVPVRHLLERAVAQRTAFDFEHRLLMPDGSVKYVHIVGRPSEGEMGHLNLLER
jgi:PAS domain-containing protein